MKLKKGDALPDVAFAVGDALRRAGIRAVITGGACAELYSRGASPSFDVDLIVAGRARADHVDRALAPLGLVREGGRYVHPTLPFHVEFPGGQLGIGQDFSIKPILKTRKGRQALILSATDSCRDRLMGFYSWQDRQSLEAAVNIALANPVSFAKISVWSTKEGHRRGYEQFIQELRDARKRVASHRRKVVRGA